MILQIYAIQALVSLDAFDTFPGLYVRVFLSCIQALELSEGILSKVAIDSLNRSLPKKNLFLDIFSLNVAIARPKRCQCHDHKCLLFRCQNVAFDGLLKRLIY